MIIIPEIETVVVLVPRTGSGSLRRALLAKYPKAFQIYRHMEADGVPAGYDRWRRVGVVRNPLDRLWSLYKFLQDFGGDYEPEYIQRVRNSVRCDFSDYILFNETVFTDPHSRFGYPKFYPQYNVLHSLPENYKSQFIYLRPDLGTDVFDYQEVEQLWRVLGLDPAAYRFNATASAPVPKISLAAEAHMSRVFEWDWSAIQE
jgi:hypothetical protein